MSILLRPDQSAAAAYRDGYMAVPAVPGAGKTTVLAYLAADLIAAGLHEPGRILVVTYTNSAVSNIRSRIGDYLELRGCSRTAGYEVRTIHSLALYVVRERPDALGWSDDFTIIDEARAADLLHGLTADWIEHNREVWESLLRPDLKGARREKAVSSWLEKTRDLFRTLIQTFKSRQLSPKAARALTADLPHHSVLRWAAEIYGAYQRELAVLGAVDFGDLMLGAHRLLSEDGELLTRLTRRWRYILEDEAQDSYRLQEEVLRLLAGPAGNLVRVGDANQAIMGTFTSAEPDLFRRFCRDPQVSVRPLTMAGRSSPDVIDVANELVRWVGEEYPETVVRKALEPQFIAPVPPGLPASNPIPETYNIRARFYATAEDELGEIARLAARSADRNPEKSLAVLLPTWSLADALADLLTKAGANVRQLGRTALPERQKTVLDLLAVLAYLGEPHRAERRAAALEALAPPSAAVPAALAPADRSPADSTCAATATAPAAAEDLLTRWLTMTLLPADELVLLLAEELGLTGEPLTVAHYLALRTRMFMQADPGAVLADAVRHLRDSEMQALSRFADTAYDRKGFKPLPGIAYVTTCHSAKGLEWDTVYVVALTRGEYPGLIADKVRSELWFLAEALANPEALALAELAVLLGEEPGRDPALFAKLEVIGERLRLMYVAITRARENLVLSCHQADRWARPTGPSPAFWHLARHIEALQRKPKATEREGSV